MVDHELHFYRFSICFSVENDDELLLDVKIPKKMPKLSKESADKTRAKSANELQQRLEIMQNKMKSKKSKPTERSIKKKQAKKLLQRKAAGQAKALKNENAKMKMGKVTATGATSVQNGSSNGNDEHIDSKNDVKPDIKTIKSFNEEGKILFPKFEFAASPMRAKKSKKESELKKQR